MDRFAKVNLSPRSPTKSPGPQIACNPRCYFAVDVQLIILQSARTTGPCWEGPWGLSPAAHPEDTLCGRVSGTCVAPAAQGNLDSPPQRPPTAQGPPLPRLSPTPSSSGTLHGTPARGGGGRAGGWMFGARAYAGQACGRPCGGMRQLLPQEGTVGPEMRPKQVNRH